MIDTHAHLNSRDIKDLKEDLIRINNLSYLDQIINVGIDELTNEEALAISRNFDKFYCALGIHPLEEGNIDSIFKLAQYSENKNRIVALGETGLDTKKELKPQIKKCIETIELANFLKLPIIIHSNNTNKKVLSLLKERPAQYGFVFHCFQPNLLDLEEIIRRDGFISVGTPITYPSAKRSLEVVKNIPLDQLLIELDYPYMCENPIVEGKNVFNKIRELRNLEYEELETILDSNAKRLFKNLKNSRKS